jgi:hypothetical protein
VFSCARSGCYLLGEVCKLESLRLIFGDTVVADAGAAGQENAMNARTALWSLPDGMVLGLPKAKRGTLAGPYIGPNCSCTYVNVFGPPMLVTDVSYRC